jgi:peroxiredoxin
MRSAAALLFLAACASTKPTPVAPATSSAVEADPVAPSIVVTDAMGSPHVGDVAPDFDLLDQDGRRVRLSDAPGQVTVLAFVASFCPFSRAEQPHLRELAQDYAGRGVRVIAIGIDEPEADYRAYVARMPMDMPILRDEGGATAIRYTPPGAQPEIEDRKKVLVTSNLVIDRRGRIRFFTMVDTVHFDARLVHVRRAVDQLLAETP